MERRRGVGISHFPQIAIDTIFPVISLLFPAHSLLFRSALQPGSNRKILSFQAYLSKMASECIAEKNVFPVIFPVLREKSAHSNSLGPTP
jgi:hypothetical protein